MPRASSGTYAFAASSVNPAVAGSTIDPTDFNALVTDVLSEFNADIYAVSSADYTFTDSNSAQKVFGTDVSTGGIFAVSASTTYLVDGQYLISNVGTTSHTWSVLFALTTTTLTSAALMVRGRTGTTNAGTFTADLSAFTTDPTTALVSTAASTSATEFVVLSLRGIFRVATGGTITPQIKLSAATTGASKLLANSYLRLTPLGGNTMTKRGTWT